VLPLCVRATASKPGPRDVGALAILATIVVIAGCGRKSTGQGSSAPPLEPAVATSASASAAALAPDAGAFQDASAPPGLPDGGAEASASASNTPPVKDFRGLRAFGALKGCKVENVEAAIYQPRGDIAIAGQKSGVGISWMVRLAGKREDQVAFSSYNTSGKPIARARGVGLSEGASRVFGTGTGWAVTWFDSGGLAYVRPQPNPVPSPDIAHLSAIGSEIQDDVAVAAMEGAMVAAAPYGEDKRQLGIFVFASEDPSAPSVRAIGVTHYASKPSHPAVAADATGTFITWQEADGHLAASHFDPAGKEAGSACVVAPASPQKRDRFALVTTATGALALWSEESAIKARALDKVGCPISPIWSVSEGRWATMTPFAGGAIVTWVAGEGHLFAAKLPADGAPPAYGIEVAEGSLPIKDPPAITTVGSKIAFGWAEQMEPTISSNRILVRLFSGECFN
jgi:hypothetical protein